MELVWHLNATILEMNVDWGRENRANSALDTTALKNIFRRLNNYLSMLQTSLYSGAVNFYVAE